MTVQDARSWQRGVLLHSYLRRGRGLILMGPVGTGKSSIAACIARDALQIGRGDEVPVLHLGQPTVRWEYVPTMLDNLEKGDRIAVEERQYRPSLLVWDDFGVDKLAPWQYGYLDRIVEWRYARRLSMVITTNVKPADLEKDVELGRMLSRWRQMCDWLVVADGGDRRRPEPA